MICARAQNVFCALNIRQYRDKVILNSKTRSRKMTVLAVFSYGSLAFGPMIALFFATVFTHAHEVIILMSS